LIARRSLSIFEAYIILPALWVGLDDVSLVQPLRRRRPKWTGYIKLVAISTNDSGKRIRIVIEKVLDRNR
jgi:hypothetical protein